MNTQKNIEKLVKYIANLGYGTRRQVEWMFREGRITDARGEVLYADDARAHDDIRVDGAPLEPAPGMLVMLHKPVGFTCSAKGSELIYDLLPPRFLARKPIVSSVGRLDRDTSGLLLLTDDGALLHKLISPRSKLPKVYEVTLAEDLRGDEAGVFAGGTLMLESETSPLLPAALEVVTPRVARLTLHEGRYHQVRRMFAAVGNHVVALHRSRIGGIMLGDLPAGAWRLLSAAERERLF